MKNKIYLFLILSLFANYSVAEIRCNNSLNKAYLSALPLYDQDRIGACFGYTASQMVDYWRMLKQKTSIIEYSSPIYAAIIEKKYRFGKVELISSGFIKESINAIKLWGSCKQNIMSTSIQEYSSNSARFFSFLEQVFSRYYKYINYYNVNGTNTNKENIYTKSFTEIFHEMPMGTITLPEKLYRELSSYVINSNLEHALRDLLYRCNNQNNVIKVNTPNAISWGINQSGNEIMKRIDNILSRSDATPVGISYCSSILTNKNARDLTAINGYRQLKNNNCGPHASIIVASKVSNNSCYYLIKNTWGAHCNYDWPCEYDQFGNAKGIWVESEALLHNLMEITHFNY